MLLKLWKFKHTHEVAFCGDDALQPFSYPQLNLKPDLSFQLSSHDCIRKLIVWAKAWSQWLLYESAKTRCVKMSGLWVTEETVNDSLNNYKTVMSRRTSKLPLPGRISLVKNLENLKKSLTKLCEEGIYLDCNFLRSKCKAVTNDSATLSKQKNLNLIIFLSVISFYFLYFHQQRRLRAS